MGEAFAATEAQLEAQAKRLDDLNDQYERGETTQDAYRDSLVDLAAGYTRQAQAAERAGKSDIAVFFRNAAAEAMKLAEGVGYVSDALRQLQEQIDQNSNDAAAFAGVDALFQGDAATVAARLADEIANGVPEQLNGPARDRFAAGLTRWLGSVDLATAGRTVLNGLLTKLDGKDSAFAQQLARAVTQAAEGLTSVDLDGAVSAIVQNLSSAEAALGPDGLMGADAAGVSAYVDTLRGAIPLLERVAALAKGTNLEGVVQGALDGTRAQLEAASTRLTELFARFSQDFSADALEQLLGGITDAVDKATEKFGQSQITAEEYNGTLLAQADALAALLTRLRGMGPEYAAAADSVSLLLGSTLNLTQGLKDLDVPLSAGEAQLADMVVSLLPLEKGLRDGTMTLGEFTAAALEAIPKIEALAKAAMLAGNPELAGQYRQLANELRGMGGPTLKVAEALQKFQEYARYAQQLAGAFGQLAGAFGNDDLAANLQGVANFAQKAISLAGDVMRILANPADIGAWMSAITTVVSSIADAISGHKKAYAEAKKAREDYQKGFSIINTDAFASFTVRSRGWLADTFGGGPEVMRQINEFAANIARTIEQGVKNGFSNGIKSFLNGTGDLLSGIREGVRGAIIDAVTQALIEGAILKGALGTLLTQLTTTLAAGQDPSGIIAAIAQALPGVAASLTQVLTPIRSAIDQAFPRDMGSAGGSFSSGGGAAIQAGTPQVVIDVLGETRTLLKGANEVMTVMADAARLQYRAGELMYAAAERMYGPHATGTVGLR